jgi:hypothetical protein
LINSLGQFRVHGYDSSSTLTIHQLELDRDGYGGRRITGRPEWHNLVMFIARLE